MLCEVDVAFVVIGLASIFVALVIGLPSLFLTRQTIRLAQRQTRLAERQLALAERASLPHLWLRPRTPDHEEGTGNPFPKEYVTAVKGRGAPVFNGDLRVQAATADGANEA